MVSEPWDITGLLRAWGGGDGAALDRLTPLVYDELRRLARRHIRREGAGHPLQSAGLVHEAYIRLASADTVDWRDRRHFFAVAVTIMRRVLVDAARERAALKRGGRVEHVDRYTSVDFDKLPALAADRTSHICAVDDALKALAAIDERRAPSRRAAVLRRIVS